MRIEIRTFIDLPPEDQELIDFINQQKQTHNLGPLVARALHAYAYGEPSATKTEEVEEEQENIAEVSTEDLVKMSASLKQTFREETTYLINLLRDVQAQITRNHTQSMLELGACRELLKDSSTDNSLAVCLQSILQGQIPQTTSQDVVPTPEPAKAVHSKPVEEKTEESEVIDLDDMLDRKEVSKKEDIGAKELKQSTKAESNIEVVNTDSEDTDADEDELSEEDAKVLASMFFK